MEKAAIITCNNNLRGCVPECRYYAETGRVEDEELIQEHKKILQKTQCYNRHKPCINTLLANFC